MRLGLGTAQFGLDYGISNRDGKTPPAEVGRILALAEENGVRLLDTAAQYGDAEEALGRCLAPESPFRIVTKTPSFRSAAIGDADVDGLEETLRRSLARLGRTSVHGLLVHHCDDLFAEGGRRLFSRMEDLKRQGLVEKIGISAYSPAQVDRAMDEFPLDLVQAPYSILDQRLSRGGQLERMARQGVEFHARSVFLQGLLLMEPAGLPGYFAPWQAQLLALRRAALTAGLSVLALALRFAVDQAWVAQVVCGVNHARQLTELLAACRQNVPLPALDGLAVGDPALIDPSRWPR
jgi:aryl-alcohol dehydrogenase-like predicted oxidoreductase